MEWTAPFVRKSVANEIIRSGSDRSGKSSV